MLEKIQPIKSKNGLTEKLIKCNAIEVKLEYRYQVGRRLDFVKVQKQNTKFLRRGESERHTTCDTNKKPKFERYRTHF